MEQQHPGRVGRRLAAIVAADVAGYSRLMGLDEVGTARTLREHRKVTDALVAKHGGRIVKSTGDGVLLEFPSVVDAVDCAVAVQAVMDQRNEGMPVDRRMLFRIGINLGDILIEGDDILGDGVNVAARLEGIAEPGGVCISASAYDQVRGKVAVQFDDIGEQMLKNIDRPVRVYATKSKDDLGIVVAGLSPCPAESQKPLPLPDKPSIAVLPFQNMSGDPEQEFFADGMVEDIITELSRFRGFFVIARNSTFTYKGRAVDIKQVGRELGVRYVLEGSVRRLGNRIRITVQLIEVDNARHMWAEKYDRLLADLFEVQDEITKAIVGALEPEIGAAERERARLKPPSHLGAWEFYQRGMWHLLRRNRDGLASAQELFERAIERDVNFSAPHSGIAITSFYYITHGFTTDATATLDRLLAEASQAVALDRADATAHTALGLALMESRNLDQSLHEHSLAVSLSPNSAYAHWAFGYALLRSNRNSEALDRFDIALRLSPRDPLTWSYLTLKAASLYRLMRYDEAARLAQEATTHPTADAVWPHVHLAASLGQLGRYDIAATAISELCKLRPGLTISVFRHWPHNRSRTSNWVDHIVEGLKKAGLPE
jgi:TolB-like protein/class 3 adenylate cyclase/Flp pilus assembly protein TadD